MGMKVFNVVVLDGASIEAFPYSTRPLARRKVKELKDALSPRDRRDINNEKSDGFSVGEDETYQVMIQEAEMDAD